MHFDCNTWTHTPIVFLSSITRMTVDSCVFTKCDSMYSPVTHLAEMLSLFLYSFSCLLPMQQLSLLLQTPVDTTWKIMHYSHIVCCPCIIAILPCLICHELTPLFLSLSHSIDITMIVLAFAILVSTFRFIVNKLFYLHFIIKLILYSVWYFYLKAN